jgi:hypothetical protein
MCLLEEEHMDVLDTGFWLPVLYHRALWRPPRHSPLLTQLSSMFPMMESFGPCML